MRHFPLFRLVAAQLVISATSACGSSTAGGTGSAGSSASAAGNIAVGDANGGAVVGTVTDGKIVLSPTGEEGPFWVDEALNRVDVRTDTATQTAQAGVPLDLTFNVYNVVDGQAIPLANATVDIWQANASGVYSDEQSESTVGQNWLRGYQLADATGLVRFKTIVPGWYSGRTTHVHVRVRVYPAGNTTSPSYNWTTQLFFTDAISGQVYAQAPYAAHTGRDTFNTGDHVYQVQCGSGSDTYPCGDLLLMSLTGSSDGWQGSAKIYLDTSTPATTSTSTSAPPTH